MRRTPGVGPEVREFLAKMGRAGGKARAKNCSQDELDATARRAAISRWMRERFGAENFEELGLPGWEIVDRGLQNLAAGKIEEIDALLVAEVMPRLQYLGVPIPRTADAISDPREKLYRIMEKQHGGMAHERFSASLRRIDSFCDALSSSRPIQRPKSIRRDRVWCR